MGIGSAIGGALFGASQADQAAQAQEFAASEAQKLQQQMYKQGRRDLAPYREAGVSALERYSDIVLGGNIKAFQESPGYQFRLEEGVKALERGAAARGGLLGGAQQKALTRFGQGIGSQEYGNYLNQLSYPIGLGQQSAAQTAQLGAQYAPGIAQSRLGVGEAQASGITGVANQYLGGLSSIQGTFGSPTSSSIGGRGVQGAPRQGQPSLFGASGLPPGGFGAATGVPFAY